MGPDQKPQGVPAELGLAADLAAACEAADQASRSLRALGGFSQREADEVLDRCLAVSRTLTDLLELMGQDWLREALARAIAELAPERRALAARLVLAGLVFEQAQAPGATDADAEAGARALAELVLLAESSE